MEIYLFHRTPEWRTILENIRFKEGELPKLAEKAEKAVKERKEIKK